MDGLNFWLICWSILNLYNFLLKRLKFDYLAEKVEKKQVSMVQIKKNKLVEISPTSKYVYLVMNGKIVLRQH